MITTANVQYLPEKGVDREPGIPSPPDPPVELGEGRRVRDRRRRRVDTRSCVRASSPSQCLHSTLSEVCRSPRPTDIIKQKHGVKLRM